MNLTRTLTPLAVIMCLASGLALSGCDNNQTTKQQQQIPTINVDVFKVNPLAYTFKTTLPARVVASRVAEIRPQVSGIILKREFEESSIIKAGQSLYQIDPAIYQANYDSAMANLQSAQANANVAQLTMKRYASLIKSKAVSRQDYDKIVAQAKQAQASVMVAKASANTAKTNLEYTKVKSPISGYVGKSNVTEGALVSAQQTTPLTIVQQLDPIYIDMTQSASQYTQQAALAAHINGGKTQPQVQLILNNNQPYQYLGKLKFVDHSVNETTGSVSLRAEFANPNYQLSPGMFVKPQIIWGTLENALLVPQKGVTSNQQGQYTAKVVNKEGLIETRTLQVLGGVSGYWIVTQGINAGDQVVISGLLNLSAMPPNIKPKAKVLSTTSLTQQQVDKLVSQNTK